MNISTLSEKYIVDTHALIWYLEGNPRLGQQAKQVLENAESKLVLPLIVLAESAWIIDKKRTSVPDVSVFMTRILQDKRIALKLGTDDNTRIIKTVRNALLLDATEF